MNAIKYLFIVLFISNLSHQAYANRELINGTNYVCTKEGNLMELPSHLRKPCILCICSKGYVKCEKLNQCLSTNRPDRKRRSIRCIEEECCDVVEDVFLNNVDGDNRLVTSYRTLESSEISNQVRVSTIRYVHCPSHLVKNNQVNKRFSKILNSARSNSPRSTMNTRSVTSQPENDRPVCTLSNRLNTDTNKYRQYITTFDQMKMRLRYKDHCHFVFARDCGHDQSFTIHLIYSSNFNKSLNRSIQKLTADKFSNLINLKTASNELDGKSNYTQRYLTSLKHSETSSRDHLSLFIRIGKRKIRLDNNLNVKLDNHPILLPYVYRGLKISIYQNHVILNSDIGLKLVWSGEEVVVYLPRHFQGRTCGLCGNFNSDLTDDLKNRKGQLVQSHLRFIQSWVTGKNRQCLVSAKHHKRTGDEKMRTRDNLIENSASNLTCKYSFKRKMKATRFCNGLKINLPYDCLKSLGIDSYYDDCLRRMCPCNKKSCNCEILSSYVDKCAKVLATTGNKLNMTTFQNECPIFDPQISNKFSPPSQPNNLNQSRTARTLDLLRPDNRHESNETQCPEGSVYSECAPIDKVTCSDLLPRSDYSNRLPEHLDSCQPGCKCDNLKLWTDDFKKCIAFDNCSSLSFDLRKRTALLRKPKLTLI